MQLIIDILAGWGVVSLSALTWAAARAARKLRAAKINLEGIRAGYTTAAGTRAAGETAVPSAYTIPERPHP